MSREVPHHRRCRAEFLERFENQVDNGPDLLIGIERQLIRRMPYVSDRRQGEQFTPAGLIAPSPVQSISHGDQLEFTDRSLQAEQETIIGIIRVVDPILVGQDRTEHGTQFQ
jgi:hypothetical protein